MIRCCICTSTDTRTFLIRKKDSLIKCLNCGVIFVWPFPTQKQIKRIYTQEHFTKVDPKDKNQSGYGSYFKEEHLWEKIAEKQVEIIKQYKKEGNLLDVGCGLGMFLLKAKKQGFKVYGLDILDFSVKICHKRGLEKVKKGEIGQLNKLFSQKRFDVITASHILEHVADPLKFISQIKMHLKPKGILFIAVPDGQSLIARILGKKWFGYYHYQHLFVFNKTCLIKILNDLNIKIIKIGKEGISWIKIENIIRRFKIYYQPAGIILDMIRTSQKLLGIFAIKKLPLIAGNIWLIAKKYD